MKHCTGCGIEKPKEGFYKDIKNASGITSQCKECIKHKRSKYYQENREKVSERKKRHYHNNKQRVLESVKRYRQENRSKLLMYERKRYLERRESQKEFYRVWRQNNKGKMNGYVAKYNAAKRKAMPNWADRDKIMEIYKKCPSGWHVDHIVPLQNELVCGLHVPENLQWLPAEENLSKSNRFQVS